MANNKVSSLFNREFPAPSRSNFNLGRVNRFTADVGYIYPCYVEEVLPNSYKRLDLESLIQTNATVAPLMGSFTAKFEAFFIPLRLYHRHLDLNNIKPNFNDDFDFHYINTLSEVIPLDYRTPVKGEPGDEFTIYSNLVVSPGSLLDYLGILPAGHNLLSWSKSRKVNATPLIGYFDIFRNYYANPHDRNVPFVVENFSINQVSDNYPYYPEDFISLDRFDNFITGINTDSISTNPVTGIPSPQAINILPYFNNTVGSAETLGIPLFAGQRYKLNYVSSSGAVIDRYADTRDGIHFGLMRRTYKDDYFNSRFLNEFVAYMEENSAVTVENNQFYITQLRMQNRIAKYVDKSIFSDTRFGSWIKAHFGVKTNSKLNIPQFLGSLSSNVVFNDIYASAQTGDGGITSNQALGSRASLGQGYASSKGSFVEFKATEPGYLMVMFSLVPNVSYFQGIRKMYLKTSFVDLYKPEFDAVGYQDLQFLETFAVGRNIPSDVVSIDGDDPANGKYYFDATSRLDYPGDINQINRSIGKHPSWIEYMTAFDETHGLMTQRDQFGYWLLNRPFDVGCYDNDRTPGDGEMEIGNGYIQRYMPSLPSYSATTYIQPQLYNTIFAVDKYTDNFQVQVRFYDKTKQPMSKQILPHL